jgi:hypothetical protein
MVVVRVFAVADSAVDAAGRATSFRAGLVTVFMEFPDR